MWTPKCLRNCTQCAKKIAVSTSQRNKYFAQVIHFSKTGHTLQGGTAHCHPLDVINRVFVALVIASLDELQLAYLDVRKILADGQSVLLTVRAFHKSAT